MALRRILLDTNVCFPISLLDLMLRLDEAAFHEVLWTEDLLAELAGVWVEKGARSAESAARICDDIRRAFADQEVPGADYAHLVDSMPGEDPADHPHAAAAVARAPATIVTANTADFPSGPLAALAVTVVRPDDYLCGLLDEHAEDLAEIVVEMAADRRNPPMTTADVLDALERAGVRRFAVAARELLT
ncbi:MAG: PIN domain-containing protein [Actinomycetota bacterium]|nr:PIN domain-containing protein [Actinomycetota bacterium]